MKDDLDGASLRCFIECSIEMQDSLDIKPADLPPILKNALVRDLKMVWRMKDLLQSSLGANQKSLLSAIGAILPHVRSSKSTKYSQIEFLPHPDEGWIRVAIDPTSHTSQQTIHFHLLEGHLLVMGRPISQLPSEWRTTGVLQRLFGNQNLRVFPSTLHGMTHMLPVTQIGRAHV